jgi:hypothetical protein
MTYYWRVAAWTPINGGFSETRTFTIAPSAATVPEIASPANGASITSTMPAFGWNPVGGTTMYQFQLSEDTTFLFPLMDEETAETGIVSTVTLEVGKTYFWRVRAIEPVEGDWSGLANFTVAEPVAPPPTTTVAPPTVIVPTQAPPTINVPAPTVTVNVPTQPAPTTVTEEVGPVYIWVIIVIGAVLVIAVIVLIVRTRRTV